ncbi:unnamed protein product [Protopolystoma xenopodis]|uniref:Uncharacterized protein n=1 Tax=Protopolystoma xenopodis TaxID=117903 RepID=A0A448WJS3_9PLAT|nr:unnamed protein product [Protopolystoma xenopodis]
MKLRRDNLRSVLPHHAKFFDRTGFLGDASLYSASSPGSTSSVSSSRNLAPTTFPPLFSACSTPNCNQLGFHLIHMSTSLPSVPRSSPSLHSGVAPPILTALPVPFGSYAASIPENSSVFTNADLNSSTIVTEQQQKRRYFNLNPIPPPDLLGPIGQHYEAVASGPHIGRVLGNFPGIRIRHDLRPTLNQSPSIVPDNSLGNLVLSSGSPSTVTTTTILSSSISSGRPSDQFSCLSACTSTTPLSTSQVSANATVPPDTAEGNNAANLVPLSKVSEPQLSNADLSLPLASESLPTDTLSRAFIHLIHESPDHGPTLDDLPKFEQFTFIDKIPKSNSLEGDMTALTEVQSKIGNCEYQTKNTEQADTGPYGDSLIPISLPLALSHNEDRRSYQPEGRATCVAMKEMPNVLLRDSLLHTGQLNSLLSSETPPLNDESIIHTNNSINHCLSYSSPPLLKAASLEIGRSLSDNTSGQFLLHQSAPTSITSISLHDAVLDTKSTENSTRTIPASLKLSASLLSFEKHESSCASLFGQTHFSPIQPSNLSNNS